MEEDWDSEEEDWDSEKDYGDSYEEYEDSSKEWDDEREDEWEDSNSKDSKEWEDSSEWSESDDSSQIEITDLIERRDCDSVEIIRAVIPIKGTYRNNRPNFINRRIRNNNPSLNNRPLGYNRPLTYNPQPLNHLAPNNTQPSPNNTQPSPNNTQPPSLYAEDITFLNVRLKENKYKPSFFKDLIHKEYTTCSICLYSFTNYSKVLSLLCTHVFHSKCIIPWIKKHKQCPCCREGT